MEVNHPNTNEIFFTFRVTSGPVNILIWIFILASLVYLIIPYSIIKEQYLVAIFLGIPSIVLPHFLTTGKIKVTLDKEDMSFTWDKKPWIKTMRLPVNLRYSEIQSINHTSSYLYEFIRINGVKNKLRFSRIFLWQDENPEFEKWILMLKNEC